MRANQTAAIAGGYDIALAGTSAGGTVALDDLVRWKTEPRQHAARPARAPSSAPAQARRLSSPSPCSGTTHAVPSRHPTCLRDGDADMSARASSRVQPGGADGGHDHRPHPAVGVLAVRALQLEGGLRQNERVARLQENGRAAVELMLQDMRAGRLSRLHAHRALHQHADGCDGAAVEFRGACAGLRIHRPPARGRRTPDRGHRLAPRWQRHRRRAHLAHRRASRCMVTNARHASTTANITVSKNTAPMRCRRHARDDQRLHGGRCLRRRPRSRTRARRPR